MDYTSLWKAALGEIELTVSKAHFNTWFKNTSIETIEDNEVRICVPNGFTKEWLENKFNVIILRALNNLKANVYRVHCRVGKNLIQPKNPLPQTSYRINLDAAKTPNTTTHTETQNVHGTQNTQNTQAHHVPVRKKVSSYTFSSSNLNPKYSFSSFIVGSSNELAHSAAKAVSEKPGESYNPLFIYGGVGLGKTHLLQSIGNALLRKDPTKKVVYTTSEKFTHELLASLQNRKISEFKVYYQSIDLLIIDDVQFLSGKEKTQHEFFNIFNALYNVNKQIVISSDRPPKSIATLHDRLRSRFEGGMIADINKPDFETRIAILSAKSHQNSYFLSEDIIRYIAEHVTMNIRELEGALNRVIAVSKLGREELTFENAQKILGELIDANKKKGTTAQDIIGVVCDYYNTTLDELTKKGRKKEIVHPRQLAMYLLRSELVLSYTKIGREFGGRDHTTALHAYEKITKEVNNPKSRIKDEVDILKERIYSSI